MHSLGAQVLLVAGKAATDQTSFLACVFGERLLIMRVSKTLLAALVAFVFLMLGMLFCLGLGSLLLKAFGQHNPLWQAELMAHGSIIFVAELDANGELLHARSLEILLCIVGHVSA